MPNENMSFNSVDELHHFHTTEDPFIASGLHGVNGTLVDGRMIDSGHFLTEPAKRETFEADMGEIFGQPIISTEEDGRMKRSE